jgi:predicted nucleic acid-binding protein
LAGKAFQQYKLRGGTKTSPLPDFFIGAQAAILGVPLLTRDPRRVATAYPRLKVVSPE